MLHKPFTTTLAVIGFGLLSCLAAPCFAASPASVTVSGDPVIWGNDPIITYHIESGTCANFTNLDMVNNLTTYLSLWDDEGDISLTLDPDTSTLPDIDEDNYQTYLYTGSGTQNDLDTLTDGINPIVFDDNGEITAAFVGEANVNNVLGFAGITAYDEDTGIVTDGQAILNCRCLENHPTLDPCESNGSTLEYGEQVLWSTAVHEFGHFLGLDHSQVNIDYYGNGNDSDDDKLPIMFPYSFSESVPIALTTDDIVSAATLYPSSQFTNAHCRVTGTLLDIDGNPLRCADVQARPADDSDIVSFVSGAMAIATDENDDTDTVDDGECESGCGDFELYLEPGVDYTIHVAPIYSGFIGGSSLSPCVNETVETIEDEDIAEISGSDCTNTVTRDLGEIITASTAGSSSGGGDDEDSGSSGGNGGGSGGGADTGVENPIGYGCGLHSLDSNAFQNSSWLLALLPLVFIRLYRSRRS